MSLNSTMRKAFYRDMVKSRHLDDRLIEQYFVGKMPIFAFANGPLPGELHSSNGAEPIGVGVCAALSPDDMITADHRPHHVAIARGVSMKKMAAEILGRKTGLSGGKGGHMHLYDPSVNFGSSGIICEGMGPAAGMALARRMQGKRGIGVAFIGDGAANQGAFHEVLNLVGLHKLPFIVVVQDNKWAVSTNKATSTAIPRNSDRAASYGLAGEFVQGNDVDKIYEAASRAVARANNGEGGTVLEIETVRLMGHFSGDPAPYITGEAKKYQVDPIPVYREKLIQEKVLTAAEADELEKSAKAEADEAIEFALASPYPEPEDAYKHVFA